MEKKEFAFKGTVVNGFAMLSLTLALLLCGIASAIYGFTQVDNNANGGLVVGLGVALIVCMICVMCGFVKIEPNEARVMVFFGQYKGTFTTVGFHWVNPFISTKRLSFRARNIDAAPIKVNDKTGNPVLIGMMLVWRLRDTYKAIFEIDSEAMATSVDENGKVNPVSNIMMAFERFVRIQGDAALRHVAGQYAYDNTDDDKTAQTLRDNSEEINKLLEQTLDERLDMAGIEIIEARINYLAYAPEIAAVMLRRQQASAIISAREKIVEGAVSMVDMALKKLDKENVVALDDDKKAAMVSNLMVVLCSENATQPVVNSGTLNM
ncbi:MAG: SPFH domain-containing protein [Prevotella pallens]|uniref:SPFH domain-containing protein n=1 Tax=Prevotella pallens TaxID=60133 RepID=UPI001CB59FF2|nr:SPFH domain-containing protein [Prevotella pallens]MBF1520119.1 SPFH domain-containing protein [Prevotella pallens]